MIAVIRTIGSALRGVLKLFIDDGVYAAATLAWIAGVLALTPHNTGQHAREGLILAIGLDLIFGLSVALRVRGRKQRRKN
jgi:hypothetical protein